MLHVRDQWKASSPPRVVLCPYIWDAFPYHNVNPETWEFAYCDAHYQYIWHFTYIITDSHLKINERKRTWFQDIYTSCVHSDSKWFVIHLLVFHLSNLKAEWTELCQFKSLNTKHKRQTDAYMIKNKQAIYVNKYHQKAYLFPLCLQYCDCSSSSACHSHWN